MTVVEFIGGPLCGALRDVEQLNTSFYVPMQPNMMMDVNESAFVPQMVMKKYVYRLCRRKTDDAICYWYTGIDGI